MKIAFSVFWMLAILFLLALLFKSERMAGDSAISRQRLGLALEETFFCMGIMLISLPLLLPVSLLYTCGVVAIVHEVGRTGPIRWFVPSVGVLVLSFGYYFVRAFLWGTGREGWLGWCDYCPDRMSLKGRLAMCTIAILLALLGVPIWYVKPVAPCIVSALTIPMIIAFYVFGAAFANLKSQLDNDSAWRPRKR